WKPNSRSARAARAALSRARRARRRRQDARARPPRLESPNFGLRISRDSFVSLGRRGPYFGEPPEESPLSDESEDVSWQWLGPDGSPTRGTLAELRERLASRTLSTSTRVWRPTWLEWIPASRVAEL